MADPYKKCPCGCGRNLKHCASKPVLAGLERIEQSIAGDQRIAALHEIDRLLETEPDSTILLTLKTRIHFELGQHEATKACLQRFTEVAPDSPTVKALQALGAAHNGDSDGALQFLLEAWEGQERADPRTLMMAMATAAQFMLAVGNPAAALAIASRLEANEGDALQQLQYQAMSDVRSESTILRLARDLPPVPSDHPLREEISRVDEAIQDLLWLQADRMLLELGRQHPEDEVVLRRIGVILLLRNADEAHEAWRRIANMDSVDDEDRLFAEAVAIITSPIDDEWMADVLEVTYPVDSLDPVMEKIIASPQFGPAEAPQEMENGEPPPRGVYQLIDRPVPDGDGSDLTIEQWPRTLGAILVYGKQTDAPARIKLQCSETQLETCDGILKSVVEDLNESQREVIGSEYRPSVAMNERFFTWKEVGPATAMKLSAEAQRRMLLELWPRTPHPAIDGLTPAVACRDKSRKRAVNALVLIRETGSDGLEPADYRELRKKLGLPHEMVSVDEVNTEELLPLDLLMRIPLADLPDVKLMEVLSQCLSLNAKITGNVVKEAVSRPALKSDPEIGLHGLCDQLGRRDRSPQRALKWMQLAVEAADACGHSPAEYLLSMLMPAMMIGDGELAQGALTRLSQQHANEPGVRESIMQFMQMIGIDPATGAPVGQPAAAAAPSPNDGGIWTPDGGGGGGGPAGDASGGDGSSGLWLPD